MAGTSADKLKKLKQTKANIKAAIQEKGQTVSDDDTFASYADKIRAIGKDVVLQEKTATENGEVLPDEGYNGLSKVNVNVPIPDGYIKPTGNKDIVKNGSYDVSSFETVEVDVPVPSGYVKPEGTKEITSNGSFNVTNYEDVEVNVPIPENNPTLIAKQITENGNYAASADDADGYSSIEVNVQPTLQEKTVTPSTSEQVIHADAGNDGLSEVTVEAVPIEEKTVTSNGEVTPSVGKFLSKVIVDIPSPTTEEKTVTPTKSTQEVVASNADYLRKVTVEPIPDEYIIPSGSETITENGTHDISGKEQVIVNVPSEEPTLTEKTITANGTYKASSDGADGFSKVIVKVPAGATAYTVSSVDELPSDAVDGSTAIVSNNDIKGNWLLNEQVAIEEGMDLYPTFTMHNSQDNSVIKVTNIYAIDEGDYLQLYYMDENENEYGSYNTGGNFFPVFTFRNIRVIEADAESETWIRANGKKMPSFYIRENGEWVYKEDMTVSGGECSGKHVIEVDELPTENIDTNAVYKVGDTLMYDYTDGFTDFIVNYGTVQSMKSDCSGLYSASTKPDNPQITNLDEGIVYLYYIEDENDVFVYGDPAASGTNSWMTFGELYALLGVSGLTFKGTISDISEATEQGYYAQLGAWKEYSIPTGELEITEDGTYDVSDKASVVVKAESTLTTRTISSNGTYSPSWCDGYSKVTVSVPTVYVAQTALDLPTDAVDNSLAFVLEG